MIDALFEWCVSVLLLIAGLTGWSYEAVNVVIFCVIWPVFTLYLMCRLIVLKRQKLQWQHLVYEIRANEDALYTKVDELQHPPPPPPPPCCPPGAC